ncbi:F-box associated interaction domain [Arabidopsis suecica]|uniref:F-box associated interaction domain n=1 Tax=Arabidopsis suecica TaxID=45249 RepID=A0A8T2BG48_ARASU|nr:F-box associated interaction domain [Arabidopsis suecica]
MALQVKLPWELEEDILSRLPPQSLVRFRSVCKRWNSLFSNNYFLNNHLSRSHPEFIILTNSKIYSVDIIDHKNIDPTIELRELPSSDIPDRETNWNYGTITTTCDEFLFYSFRFWENKTALWNPWLRQVRWIEFENKQFCVFGIGYDNSRPQKVFKILGYFVSHGKVLIKKDQRVAIYGCESHELRYIDTPEDDWPITETAKRSNVSLNGNLYLLTCSNFATQEYFIRIFDFSTENFKPLCLLPCKKNHEIDELLLAVYKGDQFSLLKQCCVTKEIGIWVTKERISNNNGDGEEGVEWIKLMTLSITNLSKLFVRLKITRIFLICPPDKACFFPRMVVLRGSYFSSDDTQSCFLFSSP